MGKHFDSQCFGRLPKNWSWELTPKNNRTHLPGLYYHHQSPGTPLLAMHLLLNKCFFQTWPPLYPGHHEKYALPINPWNKATSPIRTRFTAAHYLLLKIAAASLHKLKSSWLPWFIAFWLIEFWQLYHLHPSLCPCQHGHLNCLKRFRRRGCHSWVVFFPPLYPEQADPPPSLWSPATQLTFVPLEVLA